MRGVLVRNNEYHWKFEKFIQKFIITVQHQNVDLNLLNKSVEKSINLHAYMKSYVPNNDENSARRTI